MVKTSHQRLNTTPSQEEQVMLVCAPGSQLLKEAVEDTEQGSSGDKQIYASSLLNLNEKGVSV